ncbi:MAG: hypothetical protein CVU97_00830 [Firmicutes bacterium HGW-Firmicutes-21]|nr:MAG: hypothetical protein CVU97_00830 [Firmicutes bacterium HGW-Firmicutes-21]
MKKEDIVKSLDNITPDENTVGRMREKILTHSGEKRRESFFKHFNLKRTVTAALLVLVITAGTLSFNAWQEPVTGSWVTLEAGVRDSIEGKHERLTNGDLAPGYAEMFPEGRMPDIYPYYQFKIENKYYMLMFDSQITEFNLPETIVESDIGGKLATISDGNKTCVVYSYLPAGSEAVVVVKIDDKYELYTFNGFDSYINNQDEDAKEYLKLYGIKSDSDIAKIQFMSYNQSALPANGEYISARDIRAELTDKASIQDFYKHYSAMKNSSDKYFGILYSYKSSFGTSNGGANQTSPSYGKTDGGDMPTTVAPDQTPITDDAFYDRNMTDGGVETPGSIMPSEPADSGRALMDSITIRIYNRSGIYFDVEYYTNINFISRYEVSDAFTEFLKGYIG